MKGTRQKPNQAVKDGQAAGAWLAECAPHVLLTEFGNRKTDRDQGKASQRFGVVMDDLRNALGVMATDPKVADVLHTLDGAVWDCAVEHEDRAWHAAWTLAMALKGGA